MTATDQRKRLAPLYPQLPPIELAGLFKLEATFVAVEQHVQTLLDNADKWRPEVGSVVEWKTYKDKLDRLFRLISSNLDQVATWSKAPALFAVGIEADATSENG